MQKQEILQYQIIQCHHVYIPIMQNQTLTSNYAKSRNFKISNYVTATKCEINPNILYVKCFGPRILRNVTYKMLHYDSCTTHSSIEKS